jgi:hypothetical protein
MEMSVMAVQIRDIQLKLHHVHCDVLEFASSRNNHNQAVEGKEQ